jgi:hypothetical protein
MDTAIPIEVDGNQDIPSQVFESFLAGLETAEIAQEMVARLRKTLLVDQVFTESALKAAVLGEEAFT